MSKEFSVQVAAFARIVLLRHDVVMKKIAFDALRSAVEMSPVLTGRFKGSWRIGISSPDLTVSPHRENFEDEEQTTLAAGRAALATYSGERVIWVSNNLPYAVVLELGYSQQAPQGVLGPIESRLRSMINAAVSASIKQVPDA